MTTSCLIIDTVESILLNRPSCPPPAFSQRSALLSSSRSRPIIPSIMIPSLLPFSIPHYSSDLPRLIGLYTKAHTPRLIPTITPVIQPHQSPLTLIPLESGDCCNSPPLEVIVAGRVNGMEEVNVYGSQATSQVQVNDELMTCAARL